MAKQRRIVDIPVLPGEPLDGSGRVCIHLFVQDQHGPFVEPYVLHQAQDDAGAPIKQRLVAKPARGRLACDPKRTVAPVIRGNVTYMTFRSDDPRAATCPKCLSSSDYVKMMGDEITKEN